MKVKICINTHEIWFDEEACIELDLPYVPRKDDIIYLSEEQSEMLRQEIIDKILVTGNYFPYRECLGFRDEVTEKELEEDFDLEYLDIEDWIFVGAVSIHTKDNTIVVGLTDNL